MLSLSFLPPLVNASKSYIVDHPGQNDVQIQMKRIIEEKENEGFKRKLKTGHAL